MSGRNFTEAAAYSWLIVALTSASPVHDASFWDSASVGKNGLDGFSSLRTSEHGYWNTFVPTFDYDSVDAYVASIYHYVQTGKLDLNPLDMAGVWPCSTGAARSLWKKSRSGRIRAGI